MSNKAQSVTIGVPALMSVLIVLKALNLIQLSWFWVIALPVVLPIGMAIIIFTLFFFFLLVITLCGGNKR